MAYRVIRGGQAPLPLPTSLAHGCYSYQSTNLISLCADPLALGNPLETISLADKTDRLARLRLEGSCSAHAWLRVSVSNH